VTVALRRCGGDDLAAATLYELLRLRVEVFVIEQACPYQDLDGLDLLSSTEHFWLESGSGEVLSTLRLMREPGLLRIGRVCTRASERGRGHTTTLMQAVLAEVAGRPCELNAQSYLADMYARHGFTAAGPEFLEDGIPHIPMRREPRR
jgi:ElaA protein